MKPAAGHTRGWFEHSGAALVIAAIVTLLWRPAAVESSLEAEKEGRVGELAALLGEGAARRAEIERILPAATRFPPTEGATRSLAEALGACEMSSLPESKRMQLARRIYAITTGDDLSRDRLALILDEIQQTAIEARCSPIVIGALVDSARRVARTDPRPRSDWW
jgi:hypothetical protein